MCAGISAKLAQYEGRWIVFQDNQNQGHHCGIVMNGNVYKVALSKDGSIKGFEYDLQKRRFRLPVRKFINVFIEPETITLYQEAPSHRIFALIGKALLEGREFAGLDWPLAVSQNGLAG